LRGRIDEVASAVRWVPANAARVEQLGSCLLNPKIVRSASPEIVKNIGSLEKERPLLGKEGLECAQVYHAGSTSTWPKSGFTVASSVKLLLFHNF